MTYKIKDNKLTFIKYFNDINSIDEAVFTEDMQGTTRNEISRYLKYPEEFIVLTKGDKAIGYIQYFPLTKEYADKVMADNKIHDDDIIGKDIKRLTKDEPNDIYLLSAAMLPDCQGTGAMKILAKAMFEKLLTLNDSGYPIGRIISTAISDKGRSTLGKFGLKNVKILDKGYSLYAGNIEDLKSAYKERFEIS